MTIIRDLKPKQMTPNEREQLAVDWIQDNAPNYVMWYLDQDANASHLYIVSLETGLDDLEKHVERLEAVLEYIRDLARTGLPPAGYSGEQWAQHKLARIAAKADTVLNQPKATK